jgi:hypothetical protein
MPDLEGIAVTWFQMHDVAEPQEVLPGPQRLNLEAVWRMIVMDSGATDFILMDAQPGTGIYHEYYPPYGLPFVSVVPILPFISSVSIHPSNADVQKGTSLDFSAVVTGFGGDAMFGGGIPQDIDWSIEGPTHPGTSIDEHGRLVVAPDHPSDTLVIIATSAIDPRIYQRAIVRLTESPIGPGVPERVVISPEPEIILETEYPFNSAVVLAIVEGLNNPSQLVSFELIGNTDPRTSVDQSGRIFISPGETSFRIILRVTAIENPHVYGEITVLVRRPPDVVEVRFVGNTAQLVNRTQAIESVREWVDFINTQDSGIFLFGCTANTGHGGTGITLGLERANAIRDIFVREFNIDPNRITTRGLGHNNPWNRPNGVSGTPSWNEAVAASNRIVVIMSADDDLARRIYAGTW